MVGGPGAVTPGPSGADRQEWFEPYLATGGSRTGLELAMVQGIVTKAGGEVTAQRTPEGGRLVELLIPELVPGG
jgi:nitrogen fixation/metabolism regulation signal transduction histidine kinase